jgi:dihydrofolate synthase/folylpolyglutamate synthase
MSYQAAIDSLHALTPELLTKPGEPRRKFSLDQVRILLESLSNPHLAFRSVLIAGTNGKGSTAATLESILRAAGLRTGLYTSPHLERVNERICVRGDEIADVDFARLYFRVHAAAEGLVSSGRLPTIPSFFELLTAVGFLHFAEQKVELAVLEVGMGGRLDATNVVDPLLSIVTDISLDHQQWLGETIALITREKAGILRKHGTLVTLPQHPDANQVLGEVAMELGVRGVSAAAFMPPQGAAQTDSYSVEALGVAIRIQPALVGLHQQRNLALAVAAAVELAEHHGLPITPAAIEQGVAEVRWPGRLEPFGSVAETLATGSPLWLLDVAHNPAGAWALRSGLAAVGSQLTPQTLVFSCLNDKPVDEMARILFPLFDRVLLPPISSPRATSVDQMLLSASSTGVLAEPASSVAHALDRAEALTRGGRIVVAGSVYLVGEARPLVRARFAARCGA